MLGRAPREQSRENVLECSTVSYGVLCAAKELSGKARELEHSPPGHLVRKIARLRGIQGVHGLDPLILVMLRFWR